MSSYVYTDESKKPLLYAKDCDSSNLKVKYYCPTPNCKARLTIRSLLGEYPPYFAALRSMPHDDFCTISKVGSNKTDYDISNFSIDSLYNSIISKIRNSSDSNNKNVISYEGSSDQINTLSKMYYFCKGHDINYVIKDELKIKNLIADDRTNFFFTKGIWGLKLVETCFNSYNKETHTIKLKYPINSACKNRHKLSIVFDNPDDYEKIIDKIFNHKKAYSLACICVLGEWTNNTCSVKHHKQVIVV